ncbi:Pr6Pr family membrane protein [Leucobacter luti]|uniref:Pr6Pr family membrane protein n=1 Tax=Leucobacter luti TaxID=340320 RepID=UPI001C693D31|nr:Pr6Pr family membrane protein [Leucobacter luti]QYM75050.1 Pr6Pr family membrane protein [Leucobacter luti]
MTSHPPHAAQPAAPSAPARLSLISDGALTSRLAALAFRVISLALILTGLIRITGVFTAEPTWGALRYYTVLSNLLCLVWVVLLIVRTLRDITETGPRGLSTPSARWSGTVMMAITVTFLVYLIVLVPATFQQEGDYVPFSLTDNLIHIITPILLILDWLLFVPKGRLRWTDPLLWTLLPYAYLVYAISYGTSGGEFAGGVNYAYPFLDFARHGVGGVALWIVVLTIALVGVGYVYIVLDRLLARAFRGRP